MALTGTEFEQVCSPIPTNSCVVDDRYIVVIDAGRESGEGELPMRGTFTVMDTSTGTSKVYGGLPTTVAKNMGPVIGIDGYALTTKRATNTDVEFAYIINPTNGGLISISNPYLDNRGPATLRNLRISDFDVVDVEPMVVSPDSWQVR